MKTGTNRNRIIKTLALCSILGMLAISFVVAEELTQEVSMNGTGSLTSPLGISAGASFSLTFDAIAITGQISIEGTDFHELISSDHGTIEGGPYQVDLPPGQYTLIETYTGSVSSSNTLIGNPSIEIPEITLNHPISVENTATYIINIHTTFQDIRPYIDGPFAVSETVINGVLESEISLTLVTTESFQRGDVIEYSAGFSATLVSDTTVEPISPGEPPQEPPVVEEKPESEAPDTEAPEEKPEVETPPTDEPETETPEGDRKEKKPKKKPTKGKPEDKPQKGRSTLVFHETEGTLDLGPMPLTIELPAISDEPIPITAALAGDWQGKGTHTVTSAGVENQHIKVAAFSGRLEITHELPEIPSPLVVGLETESGAVTKHSRSAEAPLDLFLRVKSSRLIDPLTEEEIPWLTDLLGPMPNHIKIKDGQLQFVKSTGTAKESAETAAEEAEEAAQEAERNAIEADKQTVKQAQRLARNAAAAAKKAAREARRAAEKAAEETSPSAVEAARQAAEKAKQAAKKAERAAKKAGKKATDLNDDGQNNVFDLVIVAEAFGTRVDLEVESTISDVNGDGTVNILDLVLTAQSLISDGALILSQGLEEITAAPGRSALHDAGIWMQISRATTGSSDNTIQLDLMTDGTQALHAFQFELSFDAEALEVMAVEEGRLLSSDGADTYWYAPNPQSQKTVRGAATRISAKSTSEAGVLASITLRVKMADWRVADSIASGMVRLVDANGHLIASTLDVKGLDVEKTITPSRHRLLQNYPNPFNPETWIPYQLTEPAKVIIQIYDGAGQRVRTLDLGLKAGGFHIEPDRAAYWNGRNDAGESVASGVYFYTLEAGPFSETRKLLIIK